MANQTSDLIRVGIAGLGRSGWGIHANALAQMEDAFNIVSVCDPDSARQGEAIERFDCMAYGTIDELIADKSVELVVVATPSQLHVSDATSAMRAGKHVIVEKPMAPSLEGVDEMIAVAEETGKMLTVNQNYRYHPDFLKVREVIDSGVLGRIIQIRMTGNSFRRRWDWQTLKVYGGGDLNNKGAHPIDWAIHFFDDPNPEIYCHMETTPLSAGDAESHVKLIIKPNDGVQWRYFDPAEAPPLVLDTKPTPDRSYNSEQLTWKEESYKSEANFRGSMLPLYKDVFAAIRNGGPVPISPTSVRRQVEILERCREMSGV